MVSRATQVARALRELGFNDAKLMQQRGRRAYLRGDEFEPYDPKEGWFRVYQDPRRHGRRVKIEVYCYRDENKEELLKAEEVIQNMIPEAYIHWAPSELKFTATWLEPTMLRARGRPPTHGLVG